MVEVNSVLAGGVEVSDDRRRRGRSRGLRLLW